MKLSRNHVLLPLFLLLITVVACSRLWNTEPKSGSQFLIKVKCEPANCESDVKLTVGILESRASALGLNYKSELKSKDEIVFRIGVTDDPERIKKILFSNERLELRHVISSSSPSPVQQYNSLEEAKAAVKDGQEALPYSDSGYPNEKKYVITKTEPIVSGKDIRDAQAVSRDSRDYQISFSLKKEGAVKFGEWTAANINQYMAVVLNKEVKSVAYIKSQITDSGEISGRFTKQSAEDLVLVLRSGVMPAPIELLEETVFGK